jgi:hypothetical protein
MATTSGTPAARAWSIASIVCGITSVVRGDDENATSVTLAPRERMRVKAS